MPTLANFQGSSLVPDLTQSLNLALGAFGTKRERDKEQAALGQQAEIQDLIGVISQGGAPGADATVAADQEAAMLRLGALNPAIAKSVRDTLASGDAQAQAVLQAEAEKGVRRSAFIQGQPDFAAQQKAIGTLAQQAAANGEPLDRFIELQNMSEDQLGLELQRMQVMGADLKTLTAPPETFAPVLDATGNIVGQKSSKTGRVVSDPRSPDSASAPGMASAKTTLYGNGTVLQALPNGKSVVLDPEGNEVKGEDRLRTLGTALNDEIKFKRTSAGAQAAGKAAISQATKAFESIGKIKTSILNVDKAIDLIDEGAGTGPIMSKLPSIRSASIQLDNVQKAMGLDVIGTTTFGALSKGELDLALSKALPTNLKGPALREWLVDKKAAQEKLSSYLEDVAIYLGTEGNTVAGWLQAQRDLQGPQADETVAGGPQEGATATNPATNETIVFRGGQWQTQ